MDDETREEMRRAILGLAGSVTAADDQAQAMTDAELGQLLLTGRWTTTEVHEAGLRLVRAAQSAAQTKDSESAGRGGSS